MRNFLKSHFVRRNTRITWLVTCASWGMLLLVILSACSNPISSNNNQQGNQSTQAPSNQSTQAPPGAPIQCSTHTSNPVTLNMYYGSEKQAWIDDVVADFNSHTYAACDGPITVKATPGGSGQLMQQILNGSIKPDIWSPAGAVWLTLLNADWREKTGADLIGTGANDAPSLVTSPVVIAMWKPEAQALGWPNKPIGWADIARLSTDPRGWSAYGHPEFGAFKFGHTHPDYSNSGLDAIIAMNYAGAKKTRGLTSDDVNNPTTKNFVGNVESSVIHYGDSTGFFADKMFSKGPGYLSATVMYENLVVEANDGKKYPNLSFPVVSIYPKEGTFYSDHPYAVLQASWVTPAKKAAAQAFRQFLLEAPQQRKALQYGFRPADLAIKLGTPIDAAHGADPTQPEATLPIPGADVVRAIKASWQEQKRKVDVMLILDRSGSMQDNIDGVSKIDGAKQGLQEFVKLLSNNDQLGLTIFSDNADLISPMSQLGPKRQDISTQISNIVPGGSTRLYDTISDQVKALQALSSKDIKAVVVLTDGMDTSSNTYKSADQLAGSVTASGEDAGRGVKVFSIGYGNDADKAGLQKISAATGGQEYDGTPQNIKTVYTQISEFF